MIPTTIHTLRQKAVVLVVFALVLVFLSSLTPKIFGEDVKLVLETRLSSLELSLEEKTDKIRSLEKIVDLKENQAIENKAKQADQATSIEAKDLKLSVLSKELEALKQKQKSFGDKVNKRFSKKIYNKKQPEYQKVTYLATDSDADYNELIIMASIAHSGSYGTNRKFEDFLKVIQGIEFNKKKASLGLLVGSKEEFQAIQSVIDKIEDDDFFSSIVIVQSEFIESLNVVDRELRHKLTFQKERRRAISRARNFLITNTLKDETYTLCLDSDMIEIPKDTLNIFVKSGKDIVVPRIRQGGAENYDFNSWVGKRIEPNAEEEVKLDSNDLEYVFVPKPDGDKAAHMHDLFNDAKYGNTDKEDLSFATELDSVGGAVLFLKSEIFKQGVNFPPYYIIGTKWGRLEGYDGIETEGVCYQARTIGYKCWGMPNLVAWHNEEFEKEV